MFFTVSFYIALAIFGLGLLYKVSTWFRYGLDMEAGNITPTKRASAAIKGIFLTLFSEKIIILLKVLVLDVILQVKVLRESPLRWLAHICIYVGFMMLLLMHALDEFITYPIFPDYYSTLNPFMFLRDLFGALVILGIALAIYRRRIIKAPRLITNFMDKQAIIIVAVIMISGLLLEGTKIVSHTRYQEMVEDYSDLDDEQELESLEAYWVKNFGVVSTDVKGPFDKETIEQGEEAHEMSCAGCHSRPQWAFMSYPVAKIIKPVAMGLDRAGFPTILLYIHFLACFVGLAYLPFSKMFHIIASPMSLLSNAVMAKDSSDPVNIATRQMMELDACTHCGACTSRCAVGVTFEEIPNVNILPSEKIASVKKLAAGKKLSSRELRSIQEGLYLCTNCHRCTEVCPVGINLQDLWFNVREALLRKGHPELLTLSPLSIYRGLKSDEIEQVHYQKPLQLAMEAVGDGHKSMDMQKKTIDQTQMDKGFRSVLGASLQGNTFSACFTCMTCTNACPVARNFENPPSVLGLVPHQILHAAIVGLPDLIFSSNMLWSCLGCYQCQDHCPQGVQVADILFELKNLAIKHAKEKILKS